MNILLIGKYTWFQINNKFEQIANVENEKVIEATIDEAYANYNDYSQYYFICIMSSCQGIFLIKEKCEG